MGRGNLGVEGQGTQVEVRSVSALGAPGGHAGVPTVEGGQEGPSYCNFPEAPLLNSHTSVVVKAVARSHIYTDFRIHFHFRPFIQAHFNPSVHSHRSAVWQCSRVVYSATAP